MRRKNLVLLIVPVIMSVISACNAQPTQVQPMAAPTQIIELPVTPSLEGSLPQSEAQAPRVSLEEARAALDNGSAVIVDVRPPPAFDANHIAGAINVPLADIERNPADLILDKEQWIITYCT
jgi:3-mercaptopyruvate sulfurtransferase SseA